ncbi:hypothetical protein EH223_08510 [candidate division KSB1 bacterium]|nr:MAG: hypothetical protein EH223_08510 [candidate division KSB1 bacterium]
MVDVILTASHTFTVDNTVLSVAATPVAGQYMKIGTTLFQYFEAGDNMRIRGFAFQLPYQFTLSSYLSCHLNGNDAVGNFDLGSHFGVPVENQEFELDWFYENARTVKFRIFNSPSTNISMVNCPDVLNGQVLYAYSHLRVEHTLPMIV